MAQDVLVYYAKVFPKLKRFLKNREIATITKLKDMEIVKRGSNHEPLFVDEAIKNADKKFFDLRKGNVHLKDVEKKLTKKQVKIWQYFVPRKLIELHYAVNHEHPNKPLDRIYFDIDRMDIPAEKAQLVALKLIEVIKKDRDFTLSYKIFPMWTGNSFHVYLLLKKKVPHSYYEKNFHVEMDKPKRSFTGRWALKVDKELKNVKVVGGHQKKKGCINIDPSQSPSGKIARSPFSLYVKSYSAVRGVAIPLTVDELSDPNLVSDLRGYTIEKVIKNLNMLAKKLP